MNCLAQLVIWITMIYSIWIVLIGLIKYMVLLCLLEWIAVICWLGVCLKQPQELKFWYQDLSIKTPSQSLGCDPLFLNNPCRKTISLLSIRSLSSIITSFHHLGIQDNVPVLPALLLWTLSFLMIVLVNGSIYHFS
jgi:hypothetical protein